MGEYATEFVHNRRGLFEYTSQNCLGFIQNAVGFLARRIAVVDLLVRVKRRSTFVCTGSIPVDVPGNLAGDRASLMRKTDVSQIERDFVQV